MTAKTFVTKNNGVTRLLCFLTAVVHAIDTEVCDVTQTGPLPANYSSLIQVKRSGRNLPTTLKAPQQHRIFCFAVVTAEETLEDARRQMQLCDDHVMLSNFSDPQRKIVNYIEHLSCNRIAGYVNVTMQLAAAWDYVANFTTSSSEPGFQWIVKMDPDTFFRPQYLPEEMFGFDPSQVIGFAAKRKRRMLGSLEILSIGAVRALKPLFKSPLSLMDSPECSAHALGAQCGRWCCWMEDLWLTAALTKSGGTVVSHPSMHCYLANYFVPPFLRNASLMNAKLKMQLSASKKRWGAQEWNESACTSFVAIHPVKSSANYKLLQELYP